MINYIETIQEATEGPRVVTRHYPDCVNDFLRWQVGIYTARPVEEPLYETIYDEKGNPILTESDAIQHRLIGYETNPTVFVKVFHLLGFGADLKIATAAASPKLAALAA